MEERMNFVKLGEVFRYLGANADRSINFNTDTILRQTWFHSWHLQLNVVYFKKL